MPWRYSAFGLNIEADLAIPGLISSTGSKPADVAIETSGALPCPAKEDLRDYYVSSDTGENGRPLLRVWASSDERVYRFLYDDGAEFLIEAVGRRIEARWPEALTIDDIAPYITGPILGFILVLRGITALHASAIAVDGKALAFLGPPGAGKSTTAAAFAQRGLPVLSDDIVAMVEQGDSFVVHPGYPWIRLWPPSVDALFGSPDALPRISPQDPNWTKHYLDLSDDRYRFGTKPLPLGAVYILERRSGAEDAPKIIESAASVRLLSLVGNTYMNYLLDKKVRAREFELVGRIARRVPVKNVVPHRDSKRLPALCELILGDYAALRR